MTLSILHRITGAALSVGSLLLVGWLVAAAAGPESYAILVSCLSPPLGKLVIAGFTFALVYHFCNGIRHLLWDTGWGLDVPTARATAWVVALMSLLLTAAILYAALGGGR